MSDPIRIFLCGTSEKDFVDPGDSTSTPQVAVKRETLAGDFCYTAAFGRWSITFRSGAGFGSPTQAWDAAWNLHRDSILDAIDDEDEWEYAFLRKIDSILPEADCDLHLYLDDCTPAQREKAMKKQCWEHNPMGDEVAYFAENTVVAHVLGLFTVSYREDAPTTYSGGIMSVMRIAKEKLREAVRTGWDKLLERSLVERGKWYKLLKENLGEDLDSSDTWEGPVLRVEVFHGESTTPLRTLMFFDEEVIRIGRNRSLPICLEDDNVARLHAVISRDGPKASIIDLGSPIGTDIRRIKNNKEYVSPVGRSGEVLVSGDRIDIGMYSLKVTMMNSAQKTTNGETVGVVSPEDLRKKHPYLEGQLPKDVGDKLNALIERGWDGSSSQVSVHEVFGILQEIDGLTTASDTLLLNIFKNFCEPVWTNVKKVGPGPRAGSFRLEE